MTYSHSSMTATQTDHGQQANSPPIVLGIQ